MMTQLPVFTPALDDRLTAEFLAHTLTLLAFPLVQESALLDSLAWRFERPEPPRDPDLPILAPKSYPRPAPALVEATIRALQPPPPVSGFIGRRAELDQAVIALINGQSLRISGSPGSGKTALLRQIAADPRVRKRFRRVWWFNSLTAIGDAIGLALELPQLLRADPADQPALAREFLTAADVLLLVDNATMPDAALSFGTGVAVVAVSDTPAPTHPANRLTLGGLSEDDAARLIQSANPPDALTLIRQVDANPRALKLIHALLTEDGLPPEVIGSLIQDHPVADLYAASFAALPGEYQTLCGFFPEDNPVALTSALAYFSNPIIGQRALTFLERRAFIERQGDVIRAVGDWVHLPNLPPRADTPFAPIPFPASAFRGQIDTHNPDDPREQARQLHIEGIAAMDRSRDAEAETLLAQALELRQQHDHDHAVAETLTALARLAWLQGDDASAIRQLEAAAELLHGLRDDESLNIVRIALSRAYQRAGRLDAALSVLGDDAPPDDVAAVHVAREDWDAALEAYSRLPPDSESAQRGIAYALLCAGRYADALQSVANVDNFNARYTRGLVYHLQGDFERALQAYDRADTLIALDSDRGPLARARGRAFAARGQLREAAIRVGAEGIWYEAKMARPVFARQQIGQALYAALMFAQGNRPDAESAAHRALECAGERPDAQAAAIAYHILGRLNADPPDADADQSTDRVEALSAYQSALAARESQPHRDESAIGLTLHLIADEYTRQGDDERAVANYRRALSHLSERPTRLITLLALRDGLFRIGRDANALEAGQQAIDLLLTRPEADLQPLGYVMALHTQSLIDGGRGTRADQVFLDWQTRLSRRAGEAFDSPLWGVQILGIGLIVRSVTPTATALYSPSLLYNLAEEALSLAESHAPDSSVAWAARRDLGNVLIAQARWAEAYEMFAPLLSVPLSETIAQEAPFIALSAHIGSARAAVALDHPADAAAHFDAAALLEPEQLARGRLIRESAAAHSQAGDDEAAARRYGEALALLDQAQALDEHVAARVALAYVRLRLGQFGAAIDTFEEALGIVQELPDPALMASVLTDLATAHHTLGQYRRAAATYRRALAYEKIPERAAETLIALARSSAAMQAYPQALEAFHDALQHDLSPAQRRSVLIEQAAAYAAIEQRTSAIETYNAALTIEGIGSAEQATIRRGLGQIYARMGAHDDARANFEQALQAVEDDQTGLTLRAIAEGHRVQGQVSAAQDAYSRALPYLDRSVYPVERAATLRAMGEIYLTDGRAAEAITALENALDIERALPQQDGGRIVSTLQSIAAAHELRGEIEKATRRHHEALVYQDQRHAPDQYARTLYTLGRLYAQIKHYDDAARALEDALATDYAQPTPDVDAIDAGTKLLADVYRAQNRLEQAADLYRRVTTPRAAPTVREDASRALDRPSAIFRVTRKRSTPPNNRGHC